jgi:hypothetical protein
MKCRKLILGGCLLSLMLFVRAEAASAQDVPQEGSGEKPKPAARSYPIPIVDNGNQQDENGAQDTTNGLQPDTTPLTGVQTPTLGIPELRHNYWVPGIQYSGQIQSNSGSSGNTSSWFMNNFMLGNLSLLRSWSRSQLAINYSGGGYFTTESGQGNGYSQILNASQNFQWERWQLQLLDQFSYLPQSQFGFGAGTNLGIAGVGGSLGITIPGLGGSYVPNQSLYSAQGPRYSNAAVVQTTYQISPRGSITASGSYGLLQFVDPGNVDSTSAGGSLGYNYTLNQYDTIGLVYNYRNFHYQGESQAFGNQVVSVAYGRKLTGRMALQIFAGPSFTTYRVPVNGNTSQLGANVSANLNLGFQNGGIALGYLHTLTAGGGVLTGSTLDEVNFSVSRTFGRVWNANANFGYAHNKPAANASQSSPSYNTVFAGGGLSHPLGKNMNLAFAYQVTFNNYNLSGCGTTACTTVPNQTTQYITVNFQWHTRPFLLP